MKQGKKKDGLKITRRQFLKGAAATGVGLMLPLKFGVRSAHAYAVSPGLQKFIDPLPLFVTNILPATAVGGVYDAASVDYYALTVEPFRQIIHTGMDAALGQLNGTYTGTQFYGYRNTAGAVGSGQHLGGAIIATKGKPVRIKFTNNLPGSYILPFDPTIPSPGNGGARVDRIATHLHGGLVPWTSDGGPFHWFTPDGVLGSSLPPNGWLHNATGQTTNDYYYPNNQSARFMWYHDHAIGITRTNAYAGIAAPYIIADPGFEGPLGLPDPIYLAFQDKVIYDPRVDANYTLAPPTGGGVTNALGGDLWYPYIYDPKIWKLQGSKNKAPKPSAVPEMAGDTMLVNGHIYPFHRIDAGMYRVRMLSATNTRFLNLQFVYEDPVNPGEPLGGYVPPTGPTPAPVDVWIIGSEGGYLPAAIPVILNGIPQAINPLLMAPAERLDLIIDFSACAGSNVLLYNDAPAPYPIGAPIFDFYPGNALNPNAAAIVPGSGPNTRTLMRFEVSNTAGPTILIPGTLSPSTDFLPTVPDTVNGGGLTLPNTANGALYTVGTVQYSFAGFRNLTLNEGFDAFGRLIQMIGTNLFVKGVGFGRTYAFDAPTETVKYKTVEIWNIINLTADTHPMHTHLFNAMVLRRQPFKVQNFKGTPVFAGPGRGPEPYEIGWKETFKCPPGEVTVIAVLVEDPLPGRQVTVTPDPALVGGVTSTSILPYSPRLSASFGITADEYVWHCHILEHEEHDMMRPIASTP